MDDDAELLLAGPRGRRLCLELAADLDAEIRSPLQRLAHEMDPGKGQIRVYVAFAGSGTPSDVPQPPTPSVGELAALLSTFDPAPIEAAALHSALAASVDRARYWQEPDGEDVVAGQPEIWDALVPIARAVVAVRATECWKHPVQDEQWVIDWSTAGNPAPALRPAAEALAQWAAETREEEARAAIERPRDPRASFSGSWWSIPHGTVSTVGRMPAALDLIEDSFGWEEATVRPVRGSGEVLEISGEGDWAALCRRYPLEVTASRRHDWYRVTGRDGRWVIPDWHRVAEDWAGVHLSTFGYLSSATMEIEVDAETASVIAGWAPDTTIWLNEGVHEAGALQEWAREPESGVWLRR